jgi:hypothetical protein
MKSCTVMNKGKKQTRIEYRLLVTLKVLVYVLQYMHYKELIQI